VVWEVEGTDEFGGWFLNLTDDEQVSVGHIVDLLVEHGPSLPFPCSSGVEMSRHRHMRELSGFSTRIDMKSQKWSEIKERIKPETRARIETEARRLSDDLHLSQLRKARGLTQEAMADLLGVTQAEVSKMERRTELYVGTLRKFIEAMNGELVIAARFADGVEVPITLSEAEDAR
jgi:DNA-binding transcriptional regulator YiaG